MCEQCVSVASSWCRSRDIKQMHLQTQLELSGFQPRKQTLTKQQRLDYPSCSCYSHLKRSSNILQECLSRVCVCVRVYCCLALCFMSMVSPDQWSNITCFYQQMAAHNKSWWKNLCGSCFSWPGGFILLHFPHVYFHDAGELTNVNCL